MPARSVPLLSTGPVLHATSVHRTCLQLNSGTMGGRTIHEKMKPHAKLLLLHRDRSGYTCRLVQPSALFDRPADGTSTANCFVLAMATSLAKFGRGAVRRYAAVETGVRWWICCVTPGAGSRGPSTWKFGRGRRHAPRAPRRREQHHASPPGLRG
jgi:hypothetical protein